MRRLCVLGLAALCVFCLFGCSLWTVGDYVSVKPHSQQYVHMISDDLEVSSYEQIVQALKKLVAEGLDSGIIFFTEMTPEVAGSYMATAVQDVLATDPVSVYAVENIVFDVGKNSGREAIAVSVTYIKSRAEVLRVQYIETMEDAEAVICEALKQNSASVAFRVDAYADTDLNAIVRHCTQENPEYIMEQPSVMSAVYPETGEARLVELVFTYQTEKQLLAQMQEMVYPIFFSAELYVQGESSVNEKYARLYSFLMERFDYKIEYSVTPTYSLLQDGVGDSGAFSCVYAKMCEMADLECYVINGTRNGEPWTWNMVKNGDRYGYVDLVRCNEIGQFRIYQESEMFEYEWQPEAIRFVNFE